MLRHFRIGLGAALALGAGLAARAEPAVTPPEVLRPHLVEVEPGRSLHMACVGKGSPTVVFEQGEEGSIASWRKVLPQVAAVTQACVYDRAGFGLSDPSKIPISGIAVGDDLRRLLRAADVRGPVVLVGQSIGGFYATLFAHRFPQQVAGLVLVDPDFPGQVVLSSASRQRRREVQAMGKERERLGTCADLARQGKLSREAPQGCFQLPPELSEAEAGYVLAMATRPAWYEAQLAQFDSWYPTDKEADSLDWRQERLARRDFGDTPLVVLTSQTPPRMPAQTDKAYADYVSRWAEAHRSLAARSKHGEQVVVTEAGHDVQLDQPQAVVDAVKRVLAQAGPPPAEAPKAVKARGRKAGAKGTAPKKAAPKRR
jgi:pimeloyl-ACP methyl ester carboxylesterase